MRTSTIVGFVLVVVGILNFIAELGIIHVSGQLFSAGVLWPLVLVVSGVASLKPRQRRHFPVWSLFLIVVGLALSVRNSGYLPALAHVGDWSLVWALFFVFLGIQLLTPHRHRTMHAHMEDNGKRIQVSVEDIASTFRGWKPKSKSGRRSIGDISIGRNAWTLKDMDFFHYIGDVRVNLATAHVEDGTYHVRIGGWIGDVRVLVPAHLPVLVDASVAMGDLTVFDENSSGTGRKIHYEDLTFAESAKRVILDVDLKIGDVQVVRV